MHEEKEKDSREKKSKKKKEKQKKKRVKNTAETKYKGTVIINNIHETEEGIRMKYRNRRERNRRSYHEKFREFSSVREFEIAFVM